MCPNLLACFLCTKSIAYFSFSCFQRFNQPYKRNWIFNTAVRVVHYQKALTRSIPPSDSQFAFLVDLEGYRKIKETWTMPIDRAIIFGTMINGSLSMLPYNVHTLPEIRFMTDMPNGRQDASLRFSISRICINGEDDVNIERMRLGTPIIHCASSGSRGKAFTASSKMPKQAIPSIRRGWVYKENLITSDLQPFREIPFVWNVCSICTHNKRPKKSLMRQSER